MEISVIIPTYNNRDVLRKTIEGVLTQDFPADQYEIVIADDGSTDGTADMVQAFPERVKYVAQANIGRSAARNLGVRAARGRILLFLDSDIWATPRLLSAHYRHYLPDTRWLGVQGRSLTHPDARVTPFMKAREITPDLTIRPRRNLSPVHIITRNFSMLRADFDAVGGFDTGFTGYGWEDIELAMRLQPRGATFDYDPDALAYHYHIESLEGLTRKLCQAGAGAVYFWRKHGRPFRLGLFLEVLPVMLPLKWFVFRTPLFMPLIRWILPRAEARQWLFLLNECYTELVWEAYYEGVFAALRRPAQAAGEATGAAAVHSGRAGASRGRQVASPPAQVGSGERSAHGD